MKQRTDTRTAKFFRPKVAQMIGWKEDCHGHQIVNQMHGLFSLILQE
jgi:hypothetical protein